MFITTKKHEAIVRDLKEDLKYLEIELTEARDLKKVLATLAADRKSYLTSDNLSCISASASGYELTLPATVPVYVEDYFGGKVIKQEATPVTILDAKGKATYSQTAKKPKKGMNYILVQSN